jgi:hypothetical protein
MVIGFVAVAVIALASFPVDPNNYRIKPGNASAIPLFSPRG